MIREDAPIRPHYTPFHARLESEMKAEAAAREELSQRASGRTGAGTPRGLGAPKLNRADEVERRTPLAPRAINAFGADDLLPLSGDL